MADYSHHESRTTTTTVTVSSGRVHMDINYIKSLQGILKLVEIILSFIVFICSVASCGAHPHAGFAAFVSIVAFIVVILLLLLHLMHFNDAYPQIPFVLVEFVFYAVWSFFYLVAASCLAALSNWYSNCTSSGGAGAFFGFAALVVFCIDAFLNFRDWRSKSTMRSSANAPPGGGLP